MANGEQMECSTHIDKVVWTASGQTVHSPMNVIPLKGYDIILGVKWMSSVSPVTFDYSQQSIIVNWNNQKATLQQAYQAPKAELTTGIKSQPKFHQDEAFFLIQLTTINKEHGDLESVPPEIQSLLDQYSDLFEIPQQLSPPRSHHHNIPLKDGSQPIA